MLIPCLEESLAKFRLRLIHLALSGMVFVPAQKQSGINSNMDIKAKLTPSAGQVESDEVSVLRTNSSEFMFSATRYQYIAISRPTSRHLRDCSMLLF